MDKARFVQLQIQMQNAFENLSDAIYEMARTETYEWAMTKVLAAVFSQDPVDRPKSSAGETASAGEASAGRVEASKETLYPEYNEARKQWRDKTRKTPAKPNPLFVRRSTVPRRHRNVVHCPVPGCKESHVQKERKKQLRELKAKLSKSVTYGKEKA